MDGLNNAADRLMRTALLSAYGIEVDIADRVTPPAGASGRSAHWNIESSDGRDFDVHRHYTIRDIVRAQTAVDVSEHCRAHGLPAAAVVPDDHGCLVTQTEHGAGYIVTVPVPGVLATAPMTTGRARAAGTHLGQLHHLLSGYPLPTPRPQDDQADFLNAPTAEVLLAVETQLRRAATSLPGEDQERLEDLGVQRREHIHRHLTRLRDRLPANLTLHVVHGAFTDHLWFIGDVLTGLTGFRAPTGYPALELARLAFDPLTVAGRDDWADLALAVVDAYRTRHPYLPAPEIQSLADIAVLTLLTQTPRNPEGPLQAWGAAVEAVQRITSSMKQLRVALQHAATASRSVR